MPVTLEPTKELRDVLGEFDRMLRADSPGHPSDDFFARDHGDLWRQLTDGGWLHLGAPERRGGGGLDKSDLLPFAVAWGRSLCPVPFIPSLLVNRWRSGGGELDGTAYTLPVPGTDGSVRVPFADWAGVSVAIGVENGAVRGATLPADTVTDRFAPSLPVGRATLRDPLPEAHAGEYAALVSCEGVGAATAAFQATTEYVRVRQAYGQVIGKFQAVKHRLADMHRDLELARSASAWTAHASGREQLEAALTSLRLSLTIISGAIQLFGGIGFTWELGLHFYARHVMVAHDLVGSLLVAPAEQPVG